MSNITKKAICSSFISLLNEKPLKNITVLDIVGNCGVNRNTFYYYFRDIPDLIRYILIREAGKVTGGDKPLDTMEDCINVIIEFVLNNKRAVLHIYKSVNRDVFEQYQWQICNHVVGRFLDKKLGGDRISDEDRMVLISYMKGLLFGMIMEWLESDLNYDIQSVSRRLCSLKQGDFDALLDKCRIK